MSSAALYARVMRKGLEDGVFTFCMTLETAATIADGQLMESVMIFSQGVDGKHQCDVIQYLLPSQ